MRILRVMTQTACFGLLLLGRVAWAETLDEQLKAVVARVYVDGLPEGVVHQRLDELERTCMALLERHKTHEEEARIYTALAYTYAQSGLLHPQKAARYAEKALGRVVDSKTRAQLFVYWGGAIQVAHAGVRGPDLAAARRKAVIPYLTGLAEVLQHDLPEKKPVLPRLDPGVLETYRRAPHDSEAFREARRKYKAWEKQAQGKRLTLWQEDMMLLRDTQARQIMNLYTRFPFATDELELLATQTLGNSPMVGKLISQVEAKIRKRVAESYGADRELDKTISDLGTAAALDAAAEKPEEVRTPPPTAVEPVSRTSSDTGAPSTDRLVWAAVIAGGVVLLICTLLLVRRLKRAAR